MSIRRLALLLLTLGLAGAEPAPMPDEGGPWPDPGCRPPCVAR